MEVIFRVLLVFVLFIGSLQVSYSQDTPNTRVVNTKDGEYIIHTVEAGQTLYAISKIYSVTVPEIQAVNPELADFGIRIGQTLRIPVKEINKKEAKKAEVKISGDTIYHEVLKKETVYALTKRYAITEEELLLNNPLLKDGLKIGMIIKIPAVPVADTSSTEIEFQIPEEDSLILHEVEPKETLYSLSEKFGISIDSIQMVNDGLKEGLQVGTTIRIPEENPLFNLGDSINLDFLDSGMVKPFYPTDTLKVGVFLPFSIDKNIELQELNENEDIYVLTKISIEFLRGFDMAMDSLKMLGYNVSARYFDTQNDTSECSRLLKETNFEGYRLFVGPLYQVNFKLVAEKAKELHIPIVSPVKVSSRLLLDNRFVVKSRASSPSQIIYMAKYLGTNYQDSNLTIFSGGTAIDKRYAGIFQKYLNNTINDSIPIHRIWQPSAGNYKSYIKKGEHNYVTIISSDEAFVSASLSALYGMLDEDTQISVFGIDSWQRFGSIDFDYLMHLKVTYPVQQYINYQDEGVKSFISDYREAYFIDPSRHVFSSFDIGMYFGQALYDSHGNWEKYISTHSREGKSLRFDFVKIGLESGFENQGGYVLQFADYELQLVD